MVEINFQKELEEKLLSYGKENIFILSFDDGVGIFSEQQASCGLAVLFDLIILSKEAKVDLIDYDDVIDSSIGEIRIKKYSKDFLDEKNSMKIQTNGAIALFGEYSGLIDGNVRIIDYRNKDIDTSVSIKGEVIN